MPATRNARCAICGKKEPGCLIDVAIVSLHALDEAKMAKITGIEETLPKVKETLKYFKDHTRMRIILKYVIQHDNDGEVEKVQEFADREGCNWSCYITASKMAHMIRNPNRSDLAMLRSY